LIAAINEQKVQAQSEIDLLRKRLEDDTAKLAEEINEERQRAEVAQSKLKDLDS